MSKVIIFLLLTMLATPEPIEYSYTKVSWYGNQFHGRKTASGIKYDQNTLVAASRDLPFGTEVEITNMNNDKSIVVKIVDRGPFVTGRDFDLSKAAFDSIAHLDKGVVKVKYHILQNK